MGDPRGFLKTKKEDPSFRPVPERLWDYREILMLRPAQVSQEQASRCMDCATPFCHWGCPIGSYIPEWSDLMFRGQWEKAFYLLDAANNFPEITGRVCPAPCEYACVLGINDDPVTIRENELAVAEYIFKKGLFRPNSPKRRTGKRVCVVGSGPAGLSCAVQLNKAGHKVTVIEKDDKIGGILRYGIPDFKLEKWILDRRLKIMEKEGIEFATGLNAGVDYPAGSLKKEFDAILLACGSRVPRDLRIEGRDLGGIHFAMDYLTQSNRRVNGEKIPDKKLIDAKDKKVIVIGGGDTGADCVGVAHRQGARRVVQIELLPRPPECRSEDCPWPEYPMLLKTSTSHEEGGQRHWSVLTKKFIGQGGYIKRLSCSNKEIPGSDFEIEADLAILAIGFIHTEHNGLLKELGVGFDSKGNVQTDKSYMTSVKKVFAAGDMKRGQSLVVWAVSEGRRAAHYIDKYLMRDSFLPAM